MKTKKSFLSLWIFSVALILITAGCKFLQKESKRETIFDKVVSIPEKIIYNIPYLPPLCDEISNLKKGFANIKDGKLYYEEEGQGVPIVLINGGPGGTHHAFRPHFSQIKDVARVIYYDQRGTGKSSTDAAVKTYTLQQAVEDLESLRKELKIDKWTVLGWSYGGLLAQLYALKYPEHVSGLILGTSDVGGGTETFYIPGEACDKANQFISQKEYEAQEAVEKMGREGKLTPAAVGYNKNLRGYWKLISYHKPPKEDVIRMILYGFNHAPGFREQMVSEISKINILGKLRDSKIPTLIVEGKWDFLWGNMDRVEVMRKNHPRAQIEVFEKSGHMIFADEPEKFFSMLRDFLKK